MIHLNYIECISYNTLKYSMDSVGIDFGNIPGTVLELNSVSLLSW